MKQTALARALARAQITRANFPSPKSVQESVGRANFPREEVSKINPYATPNLLDPNSSPEWYEGNRRAMLGLTSTLRAEAIRAARYTQSLKCQSDTYEQHVCMMAPVHHKYAPSIPAHDRIEDWCAETHRPAKVDVNLRIQADKAMREKLQRLANEGAFDDEA